jgi:hypothetical protein
MHKTIEPKQKATKWLTFSIKTEIMKNNTGILILIAKATFVIFSVKPKELRDIPFPSSLSFPIIQNPKSACFSSR